MVRSSGKVVESANLNELIRRSWPGLQPRFNPALHPADLDGDGWTELVVSYFHSLFYPGALLVYWPRFRTWDDLAAALRARAHVLWNEVSEEDHGVRSFSFEPAGEAWACLARWRSGRTGPEDPARPRPIWRSALLGSGDAPSPDTLIWRDDVRQRSFQQRGCCYEGALR